MTRQFSTNKIKGREKMDNSKAVYLMISQTGTKFAKSIRKVGKQQYNHSSISLDADLRRTFGFARPQHNEVLMGRLVRESLERYTLGKDEPVEIAVFKIPVTDEQYDWIKGELALRLNNKHYMYNLFSVLTYPFVKGYSVKDMYTCIEFVAYLMQHVGYLNDKPACKYTPDDLLVYFKDNIVYKGDIRNIMTYNPKNKSYFAPMSMKVFVGNATALWNLIARSFKALCGK